MKRDGRGRIEVRSVKGENLGSSGKRVPEVWIFAPKGLNKSAQGQSRASRDATLGMNAHKPI
ncbi:MAG: hypothetical protein ACLQBD_21070, partial [Syntrophobacteraceae bacterium]